VDSPDVYPDTLGDALSHSSQRLAQLASLITAAATMQARRRAQAHAVNAARNQREVHALQEEQRAAWQLARAGWAPAHDSRWLAQADLLQAVRVWGAAAAYADADPAAASAARKCEERLRVLHPYAMAWYDRLRGEGAGAVEAMRQAVPLFGRAPHARPGGPGAERHALEAPVRPDATSQDSGADVSQAPGLGPGTERRVEEQGWRLIQQLQASALAERGYALSPDELATTLGAMTTLPGDVIAGLTQPDRRNLVTAGAKRGGVSPGPSAHDDGMEKSGAASQADKHAGSAGDHVLSDRTAAQLAAESFPCTAADAAMAAVSSGHQAGRSGARTVTTSTIRSPQSQRLRTHST
jgi:hypothetical protein